MFKLKVFYLSILCISSSLYAQDAMQNNGNFQLHEKAQMAVFGDVTNNGLLNSNSGNFYLSGDNLQTISGTEEITIDSLSIENSAHVQVNLQLNVNSHLNFISGNLQTNREDFATNYIHFLANATYSGVSNSSFIDGTAVKSGNTAFTFPVGAGTNLQMIEISAPALIADQFTAYYLNEDADALYSTSAFSTSCIDHIGRCEYWILNRTSGTSSVEVTLNFDASSCEINELCELLVTRWNGTEWVNEGNGGVTGTLASGSITTGDGCETCGTPTSVNDFSPFTLGSSTSNNPLPITLTRFTAKAQLTNVLLQWETASEVNNDYFTIEKSTDGENWQFLTQLSGAGNSTKNLSYQTIDPVPQVGINYYRLSQTDFDGTKEQVGIASVPFTHNSDYQLQPNPTRNEVTLINNNSASPKNILLYSAKGKLIEVLNFPETNNKTYQFDISHLSPGVYYVNIQDKQGVTVKKLVVK